MATQTHESYSRHEPAIPSSDRSFGMVMAAAFALLTLINMWHFGRVWPWTGGLAVVFFVFACLCPAALKPLNRTWFKFGLLLHKMVNPIVMGLVFFGTVLPTADFETIGGLVSHEAGHVPRRGESVTVGGLVFSVMLTRGGAVRWFKVTRAPEVALGSDGA